MTLLLERYDSQVARVAKNSEDYLRQAVDVASDTVRNAQSIEICRRQLTVAEELSLDISDDLSALDAALSALEEDEPDVERALASLSRMDEGRRVLDVDESLRVAGSLAALPPPDPDALLTALLEPDELAAIRRHLQRPVFERLPWTKGDYIVVGACVVVGLALELLNMAWKADSPIDPDGHVRKWFDRKFHHHAPDSPIDYQGPGWGGQYHRVRSRGHDLARFFEAVRQTASGEFAGTRWSYGKPIEVISRINQFGKSYPQMSVLAAFVNVCVHLFADFFSAHSLPLPLSSVVYDNCSRDMRKFVVSLYENGFNLRHVSLGALGVGLSYLAIEVWLWMQVGFKNLSSDATKLKRYEMRAATMGILSGSNIAGCALLQNPFNLNVPVLIATVDSSVRLLLMRSKQHNEISKAIRNIDDLAEAWEASAAEYRAK